MLRGRTETDHDQPITGLELVLRWDERRRGRVQTRDDHVDLGRKRAAHVSRQAQHVTAPIELPKEQCHLDDRADWMQCELELGDDAEISTATTDGPKQIRVLRRA